MKATITFDFDESFKGALANIITKNTDTIAEKPAEIVTPAFEDGKFIGARVCTGGEDFIIAPKDYKDGKKFNWQEAMDALKADGLATWNYRQICLTMVYRKEVDKVLKDNGGDGLDNWYWTCTEYSAYGSFVYDGYGGGLYNGGKDGAWGVRSVLALAKSKTLNLGEGQPSHLIPSLWKSRTD